MLHTSSSSYVLDRRRRLASMDSCFHQLFKIWVSSHFFVFGRPCGHGIDGWEYLVRWLSLAVSVWVFDGIYQSRLAGGSRVLRDISFPQPTHGDFPTREQDVVTESTYAGRTCMSASASRSLPRKPAKQLHTILPVARLPSLLEFGVDWIWHLGLFAFEEWCPVIKPETRLELAAVFWGFEYNVSRRSGSSRPPLPPPSTAPASSLLSRHSSRQHYHRVLVQVAMACW